MWPPDQLFFPQRTRRQLVDAVLPAFRHAVEKQQIDADLTAYLESVYLPLSAWLNRKREDSSKPLVVGVCGGQGSGKSTSTALLATTLEQGFDLRVASLSIDDIYKTHASRQRMAEEIHPLFITRGVPMTHDVDLGLEAVTSLRQAGVDSETALPAFDKATDDRSARSTWPVFIGKPDIIILEGWFVGAVAQNEIALGAPINALERDHDPQGAWRQSVNQALASDYQRLFSELDMLLMLKVESMEKVFKWRRLQERKLAQKVAQDGEGKSDLRVMTRKQVDRFIMHYERLTRHILDEMPDRADIVFEIDDTHNPASVRINKPL